MENKNITTNLLVVIIIGLLFGFMSVISEIRSAKNEIIFETGNKIENLNVKNSINAVDSGLLNYDDL